MTNSRNYDQFKDNMSMPHLTPDVIDDFVSWLSTNGYDMYSFQISDTKFRRTMFSKYLQESTQDSAQYKLHFPNNQ